MPIKFVKVILNTFCTVFIVKHYSRIILFTSINNSLLKKLSNSFSTNNNHIKIKLFKLHPLQIKSLCSGKKNLLTIPIKCNQN